jgi:sigma-B regulation protein RsbU (phosphoserine phosphatase)
MKLSIRAKLTAILLLASGVPLLLGLVSIGYLGYREYRNGLGRQCGTAAVAMARSLDLITSTQLDRLDDWVDIANLAESAASSDSFAALPPAQYQKRAAAIEARWPELTPQSPTLQALLDNRLSRDLRRFRDLNPYCTEIFVTGIHGQVIAATNKTSDFRQEDELWWQRTLPLRAKTMWAEGINWDASAEVQALEVSLPLYLFGSRDKAPVGVLKAVLNISALQRTLPPTQTEAEYQSDVVLGDGRVLAHLHDANYTPLSQRLPDNLMHTIRANKSDEIHNRQRRGRAPRTERWTIAELPDELSKRMAPQIIGYAPLRLGSMGVDNVALTGLTPAYILVYRDEHAALAPISRYLFRQTLAGLAFILVFVTGGLWLVERRLLTPLNLLSRAAHGLADAARLDDAPQHAAQNTHQQAVDHARIMVSATTQIQTGDELEELAHDFQFMSSRMLNYSERLEKEIDLKTGEIQRDLRIAREFQEALLPRSYPEVPELAIEAASSDALSLSFTHVYQPAFSVGGDFFDVFKLSPYKAGIFIADVMGHGARSALITAMLSTLLQDLTAQEDDPAQLLQKINHHFYNLVRDSRQFVFVSAFCLIIDVMERTATYATAGHPSPILFDRTRYTVRTLPELQGGDCTNSALGLECDSTYSVHSRPIEPGEVFLLFTDGISEAPDAYGEEFGTDRLCETIRQNSHQNVAGLSRVIIETINDWMGGISPPDDICLVGIEIGDTRDAFPVLYDNAQTQAESAGR